LDALDSQTHDQKKKKKQKVRLATPGRRETNQTSHRRRCTHAGRLSTRKEKQTTRTGEWRKIDLGNPPEQSRGNPTLDRKCAPPNRISPRSTQQKRWNSGSGDMVERGTTKKPMAGTLANKPEREDKKGRQPIHRNTRTVTRKRRTMRVSSSIRSKQENLK